MVRATKPRSTRRWIRMIPFLYRSKIKTLFCMLILGICVLRLFQSKAYVESEMKVAAIHDHRNNNNPNYIVQKSAVAKALETPCRKDQVPPFITYAVNWVPGGFQFWKESRWGRKGISRAIRMLYSSLTRTFHCAVELHVHTNYPRPISDLLQQDVYTTMGTRMNGLQFHPVNETTWKQNPCLQNHQLVKHPNQWLALSRSKIDTMETYLLERRRRQRQNGQVVEDVSPLLPVWVDLDVLIFDKAAVMLGDNHNHAASPLNRPWVYGYLRDERTTCFGDIFSLDQQAINDIRLLEQEMIRNHQPLPALDLQGYFGLLLDKNASHFEIVQERYPNLTFGFDCTDHRHPYPKLLKRKLRKQPIKEGGGLRCRNPRSNLGGRVASISFTAPSFAEFFLDHDDVTTSFDIIENTEAVTWLKNFYFSSSTTVE